MSLQIVMLSDKETESNDTRDSSSAETQIEGVEESLQPRSSGHGRPQSPTCKDSQEASQYPPPDGGLTAWLQVVAGVFVNALTWGYATSFGQFQLYYVSRLDESAKAVSWIGTIQVFLIFFVGTFSGRAADARLARPAIGIGCLLIVLGIFMASLASAYWQIFLSQGICIGLGGGLIYMPTLAVIGTYFSSKKALAVGIAASGTGVGGIIFPLTVQYLQPRIGFEWALRCMGFISLFCAVIINICARPRLPARRPGPLIDYSAFTEAPYMLFSAGVFLVFLGLWVVFQYINIFAQTRFNFSAREAVNLLVIMNAVGIPARIALNWAANRWFGSTNMMILTASCQGVILYCWAAVDSRAGLYAFAIFCGIFMSATLGVFASALASITEDLSKLGVRMGMIFTFISFASLTGGPIVGAIVEVDQGKYTSAQIWLGSITLVGCVVMASARVLKTGWVLMSRC